MYARIDRKKTHCQVKIGTLAGGYIFSKVFTYRLHGGQGVAIRKAEQCLREYCETHGILPPVPGLIIGSEGDPAYRNNRSGIPGVYRWELSDNRRPGSAPLVYWGARYWVFVNGKKKLRDKRFSVQKLGEEKAKDAAIAFRKNWEKITRESYLKKLSHNNTFSA